jgi:hypothetical protein
LDDLEQFWVLFTWQQTFESLALGFESSRSPAKWAKRFESSNLDSWIRLTTSSNSCLIRDSDPDESFAHLKKDSHKSDLNPSPEKFHQNPKKDS